MLFTNLPLTGDATAAASDFVKGMGFKDMKYEPIGLPREKASQQQVFDSTTVYPSMGMLLSVILYSAARST